MLLIVHLCMVLLVVIPHTEILCIITAEFCRSHTLRKFLLIDYAIRLVSHSLLVLTSVVCLYAFRIWTKS